MRWVLLAIGVGIAILASAPLKLSTGFTRMPPGGTRRGHRLSAHQHAALPS